MECPKITTVTFSSTGKTAIEKIRQYISSGKYLATASGLGQLALIFTSKKPLDVAYNIDNTDFRAFAEGMMSIPVIVRNRIEQTAGLQYLKAPTPQERIFWKSIYQGCSF